MSNAFQDLLAATIEHLQELKEHGSHFICISPAILEALQMPIPVHQSPPSPPLIKAPESGRAGCPQPAEVLPPPVRRGEGRGEGSSLSVPGSAKEDTDTLNTDIPQLRQSVLACSKCPHLVAVRKNVVFGVGDIHAKLMFVGEAPGADEDAQGEPFVGAAGQLLTKIINAMGLSRQTVYIANILKCRPDTPGQSYGNRRPTGEEMKTCLPWLEKQIDLIQPQVMVALGGTAVEGLLGSCAGITKIRGHWHTYRNIPLMPTFHPSYLLRNAALSTKRQVWEDMLQVMTKLGLPITAKQQNYFLKAT